MKHQFQSLDIAICIPGLPFDGANFDQLSIGGSESAGYYMAKALASIGHRVTAFTNCEKPIKAAGVYYMPMSMFRQYAEFTPHDVLICQRAPDLFSFPNQAKFNALWCHDLALGRQEGPWKGVMWNIDKVFVLSEFMAKQYNDVYHLPQDKDLLVVTRNGIDLATVESSRARLLDKSAKSGAPTVTIHRDPYLMVYSARPERGLDILLAEIMPRILAKEPRAKLALCGYHNPVEHLREYYGQCQELAKRYGDHVKPIGELTKRQLYELYLQSSLLVYPTPALFAPEFREISCITAMEAQACGLPMITSKEGALPETLHPEAGALIDKPLFASEYYDDFANTALRLLGDRTAWQKASDAGRKHAKTLDWKGVAEQWTDVIIDTIKKNNSSPATLSNHFWRRSDIYAAKALLEKAKTQDLPEYERAGLAITETRVKRDWAFLDEEDGFRKQYERIGSTHDAAVINWSPQEPRYAALRQWLERSYPVDQVKSVSVLDYGCAHGGYATNLLKELPWFNFTGVDIDKHGIEMANSFAEKLEVAKRWKGVVGSYQDLSAIPDRSFDLALAQEVLEHVADPGAVLRALEEKVKDGGHVYVTVPFGPWEYTDYKRYPYRAHVHEFDLHDIYDLLYVKNESDVMINTMPFSRNDYTYDVLGWWVVIYQVTAENRGKIGNIDWERKLWLQRPRQTVSVNMMAGAGCRKQILWCLDSLEHIADEVVIVDCGMEQDDHKVLSIAKVADERLKVIPGVDPKREGFETPRNIGLEHCSSDWVHWIDTDESIIQPEQVTKYLRPNVFDGYSIQQHHFACDTQFSADLPVRLFRNPKRTGKTMRWFGMIHEHPETELNKGPGLTIVLRDVHIPHTGYLIESGRKLRFNRNLPMLMADTKRYPARILQKHFLMRDLMLMSNYELQQNGGFLTDNIKTRARETINLWREHFRGKAHYANLDPITYYSQANQLLGHGFDAFISLSADKLDAKQNGHLKVRFANEEDYMIEVNQRAKDAVAPYLSNWY